MGLGASFGEELVPTLGGLLLFGRDERVTELLPQAGLVLTRFGGVAASAAVVERVHLRGNLIRLFEGALSFVRRYADLWDARPSQRARLGHKTGAEAGASDEATADTLPLTEVADEEFLRGRANYHRGVIIEALTNSLVHRDWSARERQAHLDLYDDSLEFVNPAQMIELPIGSLRYGVASAPNPRLKSIFTNQHYGVPVARGGVPMIFAEATAFARRAPEGPAITGGEFRLKVHGLC
jgi:predicted HTH transcriptional regulator